MLDRFIYEDHLGRRFVGLDCGVYMNYNDLRDYEWSYDTINSKISRFYRPVKKRTIPLIVHCTSDEEAVSVKNKLHELADTDITARRPGKIYIGDYYSYGYITSSVKGNYLISKRLCKITLTFVSDNPAWYMEKPYAFIPGSNTESDIAGGIDYAFDYPYDYALSMVGRRINSDTIGSSAFKMLIYGEITNPSILVGNHLYAVNGLVKQGETLLIDSVNKTITLSTVQGTKINWFDKRERSSYIFEPIPAGQSIVGWPGTFGFDLTIIEERSEPRWT